MKLLLHTCCAPCSIYCIDLLRSQNIEPTLYWYNPNIHPYNEYNLRLNTLKDYSKMINCNLIIEDKYGIEEFCKNTISNIEKRCINYCYNMRLEQTAKFAKENGYDVISTTLLVSPYQNHEYIKLLMNKLAQKYGLEFVYRDFRQGYYIGQEKAKQLNLYRQKYCGCIFSQEESSYYNRNSSKPQLPDGFEFLKRTPLEVKRIIDAKIINEILKEKDNGKPFEISNLEDVDVFGIKKEDEILSLAIILHISKQEVEIKELITRKEYRHQGFGTKLLKQLCGNYKQKYKNMIIGTTGEHIPFFVQNGFNIFIKQENNILYYNKKLQDNNRNDKK